MGGVDVTVPGRERFFSHSAHKVINTIKHRPGSPGCLSSSHDSACRFRRSFTEVVQIEKHRSSRYAKLTFLFPFLRKRIQDEFSLVEILVFIHVGKQEPQTRFPLEGIETT